MIVTLLLWLYVLALCWVYGWLTLTGVARLMERQPSPLPGFCLVVLVGLIAAATLAGVLAFFVPLSFAVNLVLLALAGAAAARWRTAMRVTLVGTLDGLRRTRPWVVLLFGAMALIALERTASPPTNYDSGLYHAKAIRWLESYGVVPGLANLHTRFAFSGTWFVPSALFSFAFLNLRSFHVLNGALFLVFLLFCLEGLGRRTARQWPVSSWVRLASAAVGLYLLGKWFSSPSPDIPAALLVWISGLLFLEKAERGTLAVLDGRAVVLVMAASYVMAVKLSAFPIALLAAYLVGRVALARRRTALALAMLAVSVVAPTMVQTTVSSGYPFYPLTLLRLPGADWHVPSAKAADDLAWIRSWARIPRRSPAEVLAMPLRVWAPIWYARFPAAEKLLLHLAIALSPLYLALFALARRRGGCVAATNGGLILVAVLWLGLGFWFVAAPDARFGWGFLVLLAVLAAGLLLEPLLRRLPSQVPVAIFAVFLAWFAVGLYASAAETPGKVAEYALLPVDYPVPRTETIQRRRWTFRAPAQGDQCWYQPFPCSPERTGATLRGEQFQNGFRPPP